ncbi:MAG: hypothetical protein KAX45_02695 [Chitinophagaceae bacterium]|nr:hypothetical protein [Chitinophagaceae bacterium]MBP8243425.1 hypothetical protein [Chitinophagaceae bacterium]
MAIKNQQGKISLLRVHEVGSGWGAGSDQLDAEVIFKIAGDAANYAYGFQLRNDGNGPAHQAMFGLLKEAASKNLTIHFDYNERTGKKNHPAIRIWITPSTSNVGTAEFHPGIAIE